MDSDEAKSAIGMYVRVKQGDGAWHYGRARLVGVSGKKAVIRPFWHRRTEEVPLNSIRLWKAGNAIRRENGMLLPSDSSNGNGRGPWIVMDVDSGLAYRNSHFGFHRNLDSVKQYAEERIGRRARGRLAKRPDVGDLQVVTLKFARQQQARVFGEPPPKKELPALPLDNGASGALGSPVSITKSLSAAYLAVASASEELLAAQEAKVAADARLEAATQKWQQARDVVRQVEETIGTGKVHHGSGSKIPCSEEIKAGTGPPSSGAVPASV